MIRTTAVVHCDHCYNQFGPTFASEYYAKRWTDNWADDYLEYGPFCDGVTPRFSDLFSDRFSRDGRQLICKRCTEIESKKTKGKVTT